MTFFVGGVPANDSQHLDINLVDMLIIFLISTFSSSFKKQNVFNRQSTLFILKFLFKILKLQPIKVQKRRKKANHKEETNILMDPQ